MKDFIGHNFINGERSALGNNRLRSFDATTNEELPGFFIEATQEEVDAAAQSAAAAYQPYRNTPIHQRAFFLESIADELDTLGEEFIETVCRETALPVARILGERARTSGQMRMFAKVLRRGDFFGARIDRAQPERQPLPRADLRQYKIGIGPVAVFGASNFPLAFSTAGGDTAAALAAGCPVVFKAHPGHMATAEWVALTIIRAAKKTKMPAGVFNMIYGGNVGAWLVQHPAIKAVGFTGSLKGGRALCDMAAARNEPIPVFAEMSSVNPVLVLPEALNNRGPQIAAQLCSSVVQGAGQFCTKPGIVVGLRSPQFDEFVVELARQIDEQSPQTMLNAGGLINYTEGLSRLRDHHAIEHRGGRPAKSNQAQPQLFEADAELLIKSEELLQHEVFGPVVVVVAVDDPDQLRQALQGLRGQLTATLIADPADLNAFAELIPLLETKAGRLLLNGYPTGVEVCDAMVHGGPYPATSDARGSSVGTSAIDRFLRPICFQNYPDFLLPDALKNANPLGIIRLIDGVNTNTALA